MSEYKELIKAIDKLLKASDDDFIEKLKDEGYILSEETVEYINKLEDLISDIFENELDYFSKGIEGKELKAFMEGILPSLLSGDLTADKLTEVFKDVLGEFMKDVTDAYIKDIDNELAFSMFSDRTSEWINSWSKKLGKLMQLHSHEEINNILNKGLENGESVQQVMEKLMDSYGFSRKRARATAITEILTAHSYSKEEAIRQSPAVDRKEWIHTGGHKNKPRPHHQSNPPSGQIVAKSERFTINAPSETYYPMFPRDTDLPASERVHCHCVHRAIVNDSIFGLSIEERRKLQQQAIDDDNGAWEKELDARNKAQAGIE